MPDEVSNATWELRLVQIGGKSRQEAPGTRETSLNAGFKMKFITFHVHYYMYVAVLTH